MVNQSLLVIARDDEPLEGAGEQGQPPSEVWFPAYSTKLTSKMNSRSTFFFSTLRGKFLLLLLGCIVLPACAASVVLWKQQDLARAKIRDRLASLLENAIGSQEAHLVRDAMSTLDSLMAFPGIGGSAEPCQALLKDGVLNSSSYESLGVFQGQDPWCMRPGGELGEDLRKVIVDATAGSAIRIIDLPNAGDPRVLITTRRIDGSASGRQITAFVVIDGSKARRSTDKVLSGIINNWVLLDRKNRVVGAGGDLGRRIASTRAMPDEWRGLAVTTTPEGALSFRWGGLEDSSIEGLVVRAYFPPLESVADKEIWALGVFAIGIFAVLIVFSVGVWMGGYRYASRKMTEILGKINRISGHGPIRDAPGALDFSEFEMLERGLDQLEESLDSYRASAALKGERLCGQVGILQSIARRTNVEKSLADLCMEKSLADLCSFIEGQIPESRCSVLILGRDGRTVRRSVAPSLPEHYNAALIGLEIGPYVGSCGAAMHSGTPVIIDDIGTHPNWAPFRDLALPCGLRACWSLPVIRSDGRVLGAFAIYRLEPGFPSKDELMVAQMAVELAMIAIDQDEVQYLLTRQALRDDLTELPNRRYLYDWLERNITAPQGEAKVSRAVSLLDLDDFKPVNDTYGHAAGDAVLRVVGARLAGAVKRGDVVARLGGDEFAVIFDGVDARGEHAAALARRIIHQVAEPIHLDDGNTVCVRCSMGMAFYPADGESASELLVRADDAMYAAKMAGRNRCVFWRDIKNSTEEVRSDRSSAY